MHRYPLLPLFTMLTVTFSSGDSPYGSVVFETSCEARLNASFNTALSMLYSFWYDESMKAFNNITMQQPSCCIAYWGAALTLTHPIWDYLPDDRLAESRVLSRRASICVQNETVSQRERAYITALAVYVGKSEELADPAARLHAYAEAMRQTVYEPFGEEDENAGVLYGLSLLAVGYQSASEPSRGFPNLRKAGLIEEQVALRNPRSPGALHYIIHSYDQPHLAERALDAAQKYLRVSVAVPHALHMPSHIFTDLGKWSLAVDSNRLSVNRAYFVGGGAPTADWYHGAFFLQFAMLQKAMDCEAKHFMEQLPRLVRSTGTTAVYEGMVRVPAHYLIETRSWEAGATFNLTQLYKPTVDWNGPRWDDQPWSLLTAHFVAAVSRAVLGRGSDEIDAAVRNVEAANASLVTADWVRHQPPYWRKSFDVMVMSARAWAGFRKEGFSTGIAQMREVLSFQQQQWAPEVAHQWDAHEQLAEMLLIRSAEGDVAWALSLFEDALSTWPNRFRSLAGAGKSAATLKQYTKAAMYYSQLLRLVDAPHPTMNLSGIEPPAECAVQLSARPELHDAAQFIKKGHTAPVDLPNLALTVVICSMVWMVLGVLILVGFCIHRSRQPSSSTAAGHTNNSTYSHL